jgi:hypothetical protein
LVPNKVLGERLKSLNYGGMTVAQPRSEQLAELSVRAKHAEDAVAAAQKEAHDKIEVRKQTTRADATTAERAARQSR